MAGASLLMNNSCEVRLGALRPLCPRAGAPHPPRRGPQKTTSSMLTSGKVGGWDLRVSEKAPLDLRPVWGTRRPPPLPCTSSGQGAVIGNQTPATPEPPGDRTDVGQTVRAPGKPISHRQASTPSGGHSSFMHSFTPPGMGRPLACSRGRGLPRTPSPSPVLLWAEAAGGVGWGICQCWNPAPLLMQAGAPSRLLCCPGPSRGAAHPTQQRPLQHRPYHLPRSPNPNLQNLRSQHSWCLTKGFSADFS